MADIAQLGIAVDTSQTKLAARELDNLAAAGAKAEGSTKKLGSTSKQAMEQAAAATAKAQQTMERMLAAQERQEKLMEQMAREMQQLTQALQGNASANNAAAQAAQNAAQALGQESAAAKSAQAAAQGHAQAATSAAAASGAMGAQATATGGALGGMASKVLATATAVLSLGKIISEMDAWTNMNNRIRLVTEGQEQFATLLNVQAQFASIADYLTGNGKSLSAAAQLAPGGPAFAEMERQANGTEALVSQNAEFYTESLSVQQQTLEMITGLYNLMRGTATAPEPVS